MHESHLGVLKGAPPYQTLEIYSWCQQTSVVNNFLITAHIRRKITGS